MSDADQLDVASDGVSFVPKGARGEAIAEFWHAARAHIGLGNMDPIVGSDGGDQELPEAWAFGGSGLEDAGLANELLALVLDGTKTATASALCEYEVEGEPVPKVGDMSIILDGVGQPRAVIRTTKVEVLPFNQVTADHAFLEGEGDRTLESWRREHEHFWRTDFAAQGNGLQFSETMDVVCENFRVIYP